MKNLLCIETAFNELCVALTYQNAAFSQISTVPKQHASHLMGFIRQLFVEADCQESELDAIAYDAGPASFTGIRMGAGVAMSMGYALNKPVVPLSSLQLVAASSTSPGGIVVVLNAYQGEIYVARFENQGTLQRKMPDSLMQPSQLEAVLENHDTVVSDCFNLYETLWQPVFEKKKNALEALPMITPEVFISVAEQAFLSGAGKSAMEAGPVYLRKDEGWKKG